MHIRTHAHARTHARRSLCRCISTRVCMQHPTNHHTLPLSAAQRMHIHTHTCSHAHTRIHTRIHGMYAYVHSFVVLIYKYIIFFIYSASCVIYNLNFVVTFEAWPSWKDIGCRCCFLRSGACWPPWFNWIPVGLACLRWFLFRVIFYKNQESCRC